MSGNNRVSVDDILSELRQDGSKNSGIPLRSQIQVDKLIEEIILKRREAQRGPQDYREFSLREKMEIQEEVRVQTRRLVPQLEKAMLSSPELTSELIKARSGKPSLKIRRLAPGQRVPFKGVSRTSAAGSLESKYLAMKQTAHTERLRRDLEELSLHFGTFHPDRDIKLLPDEKKLGMSRKNYREFKSSRNKKINSFVLDPGTKAPLPPPQIPKEERLQQAEKRAWSDASADPAQILNQTLQEPPAAEFEYSHLEQAKEIEETLRQRLQGNFRSLIVLGILTLVSALNFFAAFHSPNVRFLGGILLTPELYVYVNLALLLTAGGFSFSVFKNALKSFRSRRPDKECLVAVTGLIGLIINVIFALDPGKIFEQGIVLYTPLFVLILFFHHLSKQLYIRNVIKNFAFISSDGEKYAAVRVRDPNIASVMTSGLLQEPPVLVKNVKVDFFDGFMARSFEPDMSDTVIQKMLPIVLLAGLFMLGAGYYFGGDLYLGISLLSATVAVMTGLVGIIIVSLPFHGTSDVVSHFSGMMPDYHSIDEFAPANAVMIEAADLFPQESVILQGVKTFEGKRIDTAIVDVASILYSANSILRNVFMEIIANQKELLKPVDHIVYEDLMGLSAWVDEKRVLFGTRELMVNHSVCVPKQEYEKSYNDDGYEVVYLSSEGELCAAFLIKLVPNQASNDIVDLISKNGLTAVVKSVDACVTPELIGRVFETDASLYRVIPSRLHKEFDKETEPKERVDRALGNNGTLFGHLVSVVSCKKILRCMRRGTLLYILNVILGALFIFTMVLTKNFSAVGNAQLVLIMAVFPLIYWLYEKNMKL